MDLLPLSVVVTVIVTDKMPCDIVLLYSLLNNNSIPMKKHLLYLDRLLRFYTDEIFDVRREEEYDKKSSSP